VKTAAPNLSPPDQTSPVAGKGRFSLAFRRLVQ
jgi:hypothetical protein